MSEQYDTDMLREATTLVNVLRYKRYHDLADTVRNLRDRLQERSLQLNGLSYAAAKHLGHREMDAQVHTSVSQLIAELNAASQLVREPCRRCGGEGKVSVFGSAVHTNRCNRCHGSKVDPEPGGTSSEVTDRPRPTGIVEWVGDVVPEGIRYGDTFNGVTWVGW